MIRRLMVLQVSGLITYLSQRDRQFASLGICPERSWAGSLRQPREVQKPDELRANSLN